MTDYTNMKSPIAENLLSEMSFKKSQIPDDAVNTKEIDSIYSFLAHVSFKILPGTMYLCTLH